jgi:peptidoglycan/xylan/chitin deacetylase (PgdA/CDA1 family)
MRVLGRALPLALGLTGAALVAGLPAAGSISSVSRSLLHIDDRVEDRSAVALSFDDGPHPCGTPAVLDALDRHQVKATFFLVGEQVASRPALAAEIVARGHEIGIHCYLHRAATWRAPQTFRDDLDRAADAIERATGLAPVLYRPPRGVFTYSALAEVRRRGWFPVLWAVDGRDWRRTATPESISRRIARRLEGGEVILLHDSDFYASPGSWKNTLDALPLLLAAVEDKRLSPAALSRQAFSG